MFVGVSLARVSALSVATKMMLTLILDLYEVRMHVCVVKMSCFMTSLLVCWIRLLIPLIYHLIITFFGFGLTFKSTSNNNNTTAAYMFGAMMRETCRDSFEQHFQP